MRASLIIFVLISIICAFEVSCQLEEKLVSSQSNASASNANGFHRKFNNLRHRRQLMPTRSQRKVRDVQPRLLNFASCDNYWSIQRDHTGYWGLVTIPHPDSTRNLVKVITTTGIKLPSSYVGSMDLLKDSKMSAEDVIYGRPLLLKVVFAVQSPLPVVTHVSLNNRVLCTGEKVVAHFVTTISLDYTYKLNYPKGFYAGPLIDPKLTTVEISPLPVTAPPTPRHSRSSEYYYGYVECGEPDYDIPSDAGLVYYGQDAIRGQFPWLAAYYHYGQGESGFICGGSLVSSRIVVTAAHCIQNKFDPLIRQAEEATFYIGKYDLDSLVGEEDYVISGVDQFVVHPDWNVYGKSYDADIAVAVLSRSVPFSKFAKPICLWSTTSSADDLVGQNGVVAGWGKTEFNRISQSTPQWTSVFAVDRATCLRSNNAFSQLTSDRTFCAGENTAGVGPCSGDSGGGFVVRAGEKWYLRGIVSSTSLDQYHSSCDTQNFAIFTDVGRFTSWIQQSIRYHG